MENRKFFYVNHEQKDTIIISNTLLINIKQIICGVPRGGRSLTKYQMSKNSML
jgi:hypothetical protein